MCDSHRESWRNGVIESSRSFLLKRHLSSNPPQSPLILCKRPIAFSKSIKSLQDKTNNNCWQNYWITSAQSTTDHLTSTDHRISTRELYWVRAKMYLHIGSSSTDSCPSWGQTTTCTKRCCSYQHNWLNASSSTVTHQNEGFVAVRCLWILCHWLLHRQTQVDTQNVVCPCCFQFQIVSSWRKWTNRIAIFCQHQIMSIETNKLAKATRTTFTLGKKLRGNYWLHHNCFTVCNLQRER